MKESFFGYNLIIYTAEEFKLLATYEDEENIIENRICIENAIKARGKEIYLFEG